MPHAKVCLKTCYTFYLVMLLALSIVKQFFFVVVISIISVFRFCLFIFLFVSYSISTVDPTDQGFQ